MLLVVKWMGVDLDEDYFLIVYLESFDICGFIDEFFVVEKLLLFQVLDFVCCYQMEMFIEKIFLNIIEVMKKEFDKDFLNFFLKNDLNIFENKLVFIYDCGVV